MSHLGGGSRGVAAQEAIAILATAVVASADGAPLISSAGVADRLASARMAAGGAAIAVATVAMRANAHDAATEVAGELPRRPLDPHAAPEHGWTGVESRRKLALSLEGLPDDRQIMAGSPGFHPGDTGRERYASRKNPTTASGSREPNWTWATSLGAGKAGYGFH